MNLKSNLPFLLSFIGILALSLGCEKGIQVIVLLVFSICLVVSFFTSCPFPLTKNVFKNKKAVLLAATLDLTFLLYFYKRFTPTVLKQIALLLHLPSSWVFIAMGLFFCFVGFYASYLLALNVLTALHPFKVLITKYSKPLLILSILFSISLFTIIRANYNYVDDLGRIHQGYQLTGSFSRYIASFIATFLHSSTYLSDISPIPQLLAAFIMAFTAIVLFAVLTDCGPINRWGIAALIPFGTFPFFLQCYSYKYDAPYMAFSILAAIAPLLYRKKVSSFFIAAFIGTILVCTTYQASSGIFPLVTLSICLEMWNQRNSTKEILSFLLTGICGYLVGMVFFRFLIMDSINSEYVNAGISLISIIPNMLEYFRLSGMWLSPVWMVLIFIIACSFIHSHLLTTQHSKALTLILTFFTIALMCILSFGVYIAFDGPMFEPRSMYGWGAVITVWCIRITTSNKQTVGRAVSVLLSCCFFIFACTYGNTLDMQNKYTHFRLEQVLSDIKELEIINGEQTVSIQIVGTIGHPDYLEPIFEEWPLLNKLVTVQLSDSSWYWGDYELLYYSGMNDILVSSNSLDLAKLNLPILIDTAYHTILGNESHLLIELK